MLVASIKGLAAGLVNTTLGLALQPALPRSGVLLAAALAGFAGYGLSLTLSPHHDEHHEHDHEPAADTAEPHALARAGIHIDERRLLDGAAEPA